MEDYSGLETFRIMLSIQLNKIYIIGLTFLEKNRIQHLAASRVCKCLNDQAPDYLCVRVQKSRSVKIQCIGENSSNLEQNYALIQCKL